MTTSESKGRFFYKTNRFESIRITNRIESIRIANWNALVQIAAATLSGNSLRQTVHTHCASVGLSGRVVSASDCSVRGPRYESRRGQLCLSRRLL